MQHSTPKRLGNCDPGTQQRAFQSRTRGAFIWVALFLLGLGTLQAARAADQATLPYKTIGTLYDAFNATRPNDKLRLRVRIVPAKGKVPAQPIALEIKAKSGIQKLPLGPEGDLIDFPLTDALRSENPPIVSNQPKGTLSLSAEVEIVYPGRLTVGVDWYADALKQINAAVKSQAGSWSLVVPKIKTVAFHYPVGTNVVARIGPTANQRPVAADREGLIRLTPADHPQEGAVIALPSPPVKITAE